MTDGGRLADEVSDDTDILPLDLLPALPPVEKLSAVPVPRAPAPPPTPSMTPQPGYSDGSAALVGYGTSSMPARHRRKDRAARLLVLLLLALLFGLVALIAAVAGGFLSYADLARMVGLGPGEILVQNLRDDAVTVTTSRLDSRGTVLATLEDRIEAADVRVYSNRERGPWDVTFVAADGSRLGTCQLNVAGNGEYTFVVMPGLVVVAQAGHVPAEGDELVLATSSLCRRSEP